MKGACSLPSAFSLLRHLARRFWNQTWNKHILLFTCPSLHTGLIISTASRTHLWTCVQIKQEFSNVAHKVRFTCRNSFGLCSTFHFFYCCNCCQFVLTPSVPPQIPGSTVVPTSRVQWNRNEKQLFIRGFHAESSRRRRTNTYSITTRQSSFWIGKTERIETNWTSRAAVR